MARSTKRIVAGFLVPFVRVESDRERQAYSDIGHLLLKWHPDAPFSCVETGGGWALRSSGSREDVSKILLGKSQAKTVTVAVFAIHA